MNQPRGTQRYRPTQREDEDALTRAIIAAASRYCRYGYRRIMAMLRDDGSGRSARTTRHEGYAIGLSCRWLVEKSFGWLKQTGPVRQVKVRGLHNVKWVFIFSCAAHNLLRLARLIAKQPTKGLKPHCA